MTHDGLTRIEGWARDGLTDAQIAAKMGISTTSLYDYQLKFPEITDALKRGKAPVDNEVENALYKRAVGGFEIKEKRVERWKDANGVEREHTVIITREVPPDTTAQIYWLKNRRRDKWKDKWDIDVNATEEVLATAREILGGVRSVIE